MSPFCPPAAGLAADKITIAEVHGATGQQIWFEVPERGAREKPNVSGRSQKERSSRKEPYKVAYELLGSPLNMNVWI